MHANERHQELFLCLSGSHLLRQQSRISSSHSFVLGFVPPPHFQKQKLSIEFSDHSTISSWIVMLHMPLLEAECSAGQLLEAVEPGFPPK